MINKQEVAIIEKEISALPAAPKIETQTDLDNAAIVLTRIKGIAKMMDERKKQITAPLMESLASVRDLFRKYEDSLKASEAAFKTAILSYQTAQDQIAEQAREKVAARVEKGTMRADTAIEKLNGIQGAKKVEGFSTRTVTKVRITDEALIPREYLMVNTALLTDALLKHKLTVPGAETYQEKVLALKS